MMAETTFKTNSTILGAAAEHFVMSKLLRLNLIAALAPAGVPNCDIVVTDESGNRLSAVQVKARTEKGSDGGWHMGEKHEHLVSPGLYYVFVDFGKSHLDVPRSWIVPARIVASVLKRSHEAWLSGEGKNGRKRNDSPMRRFLPDYSKFGLPEKSGWLDIHLEDWSLLT